MPERFSPLGMIREEIRQRRDEGCVVPSSLIQAIEQLHPDKHEWSFATIDPLYDRLMELEPDRSLAAREPNTLPEIRELRPAGPRTLDWGASKAQKLDRFHGAWIGRSTGCALGKPVEGTGMRIDGDGRLVGRRLIKRYLQNRDGWPLSDYFSLRDAGDGLTVACPHSCREHVQYMEPDDDIHYTLVGLGVLESCGPEFDWHDVCRYWLSHIPVAAICTAEYQAVINFLNRSSRRGAHCATAAFTRRRRNPFREWVGAQIRSDGWAWPCAGKPELAAEFAYRDAC